MNKRMMLLFFVAAILGCTYAGERTLHDYLHDPKTLIQDPHFADYKQKRDELESQYLQKKISYAQYLEQKTALDDEYAREVEQREEIIHNDPVHNQ